jgi:lipase chaperone LimK
VRRSVVALAALLLAIWLAVRSGGEGAPAGAAPEPAPPAAPAPPEARTQPGRIPAWAAAAVVAPALPASLAGTDVDGSLGLGSDGRFRPDAGSIRLFDYFLSSLGEVSLAQVRDLVRREAASRAPGEDAAVLDLFDRYVAYLGEAQAAAARATATPRSFLEEVVRLQQSRFGEPLAGQLFGDDNALALAILDGSDAGLPERLRAARARVRAPAEVRARVEALRQEGASDAQIWAERAARFGPQAADRLAALDEQRRAHR